MPPKSPIKGGNKRKLMIYAGLAAAMLLVILISRRGSSSSTSTTDPNATTAQPVDNPAVDPSQFGGGGSAGGVDNSAELAGIDTDIQTLGQAVNSLQSSVQTAGASTPGTSGTDPTALINAITGAVQAGAGIASNATGAIKVTVTGPKQPGPGNTKPKKPGTKPKSGTTTKPKTNHPKTTTRRKGP